VGGSMRALKVLTIAMGLMILAGTGLLVAVIIHRAASPSATAPVALVLNGIAATQDRLAVQLQGGGADRVVLVDPHSGAVVGRIGLKP